MDYLSYSFPKDSLEGFNEYGNSRTALARGYFGWEYKVFMYRAKRNFINRKFKYDQHNTTQLNSASSCTCTTSTVNDFESLPTGSVTTISGCVISEGSNTSSCSMAGCCSSVATGTNSWIRSTPLVTTTASIPIPNSPLGGTKVIQLGDEIANAGEIVRMEQTFLVTASSSTLQYAVFALMDGTGHTCCDQPFINIGLYDCFNVLIPSTTFSFVPPGPNCVSAPVNWITNTSGLSYHSGWQVFSYNLSAYIGTCMRIQVTVGDCDGWAHAGYCFFDTQCSGIVSTSIESIHHGDTSIRLYPNPNPGEFEIKSDKEEISSLINDIGQNVRSIQLSKENNYSSKVYNLVPGIYFALSRNFRRKIVVVK